MAVTVKKAVLWRRELDNRPGSLAETLKPLADAGVDLQVVMGYAFPGEHEHAAVEVFPVTGAKAEQAAQQAGLRASPRIACLIVTGDDSPGLGHSIADKLAANGINISFVMVQSSGRQYHGVFGFESQEEADQAVSIIKEAGKAAGGKRSAAKTSRGKSAGGRKAGGAATKKAAASKTSGGKKAAAKKSGAKKSLAKKPAAKKAAAKKPAAKKAGTKKTAVKRGTKVGARPKKK
jgi:hypothetical protein